MGGAQGSNLDLNQCGASLTTGNSINQNCMAASLLLHVTSKASGYFENVWAWTADHHIDISTNGGMPSLPYISLCFYECFPHPDICIIGLENTTEAYEITVYSARGILIESQGPVWMYGTASEHQLSYPP